MNLSEFLTRAASAHGADTLEGAMIFAMLDRPLDELISQTIPAGIRLKKPLSLPAAQSEFEFLNSFKKLTSKNKVFKSFCPVIPKQTITF